MLRGRRPQKKPQPGRRFRGSPSGLEQQFSDARVSTSELVNTPAIFGPETGNIRLGFFPLVLFAAAVATANPVIPPRIAATVFEPPQHTVLAKFQPFPFRPAAPAPISYRYGRSIPEEIPAWVPPRYQRFPYFEQPANPPVPYRTQRLSELETPPRLIPPQYGRFPYQQAGVPSTNPVIPYRRAQWHSESEQPLIQQAFLGDIPSAPVSPVIAIRTRLLSELDLEPKLAVPQYQRFPYFQQPAATANPVIAPRIRSLGELAVEPKIIPGGYFAVPVAPTPAAAKPVIPIRQHGLTDLRYDTSFRFSQVQGVVSVIDVANPVIPLRTRTLAELGIEPNPVAPHYTTFPYFQGAVAPANPGIQYRVRVLSELEAVPVTVAPSVGRLIPFVPAAASNPFIRFLRPQWVDESTPAFVRQAELGDIPVVIPPANLVIPPRIRLLSELDSPSKLVTPQYGAFPYFQFGAPAAANPAIPYLYGHGVEELSRQLVPAPSYQVFPFAPRIVPVISYRFRALPELDAAPFLVAPAVGRVVPFPQVAPANPVLPFVHGQWIGDAVQPLVGIQGFQRVLPPAPQIPNLQRLFIDSETGHLYWRLNATTPFLIRIT